MAATIKYKVDPAHPDEAALREAARILGSGGLVVIPTETVYGIAASMAHKKALERLYEIKQRPKDKPFSLHIGYKERIEEFSRMLPVAAYKLMHAFWPGPLTLVVRAKEQGTIAVRMPDHEVCRRVIELAGVPVVCPSSNISGRPAPVDCAQALADLDGLVDCALDAGQTLLKKESTIVDLSQEPWKMLREGALPERDIASVADSKMLLFVCTGNSCRSVMAERMMRKMLEEKGRRDVETLSAGTMSMNGMEASAPTQAVLRSEGADASDHRSQAVTREMLTRADMIVVMEKKHEGHILTMAPQVKNRLFLLKEFAKINDDSLDLADPIGRDFEFYQSTFAVIKEALRKITEIV
ncbi:MAG: threonylcarbamoyl-AMP synthase [Candidatus Omnitrophica bacterium]|nr:threonylcarbamoyl-AMP synthase [Candidatus Omnitrophota bacterium]